jgi:glycosyltransferase involved in cell wall biosynthesis
MRITIVSSIFAPSWGFGGPVRLLHELSLGLAKAGHSVTVLTSNASDGSVTPNAGTVTECGVRITRLPVWSQKWARERKIFLAWNTSRHFAQAIRRADVVYVGCTRDPFVLAGAWYARRFRKPYLVSAFGTLPGGNDRLKTALRPLFDGVFTRRVLSGARSCLAQTDHEADLYREIGVSPDRIRLIPLAADGSRFQVLPPRGEFRRLVGLHDQDRIVLFVGRLHYLKGVDTLIRAFVTARKTDARLKLVVVGRDDGDEQRLKAMAASLSVSSDIVFTGPRYGVDAVAAYADADVFVLSPRYFEETTLAGLEACFCGTPVVVTRQADIPSLQDMGAGHVVENCEHEIASAILRVIQTEEVYGSYRRRAREFAYAKLEWSVVLPMYEAAFRDAITSTKAAGEA